jgi:hypothetical protein
LLIKACILRNGMFNDMFNDVDIPCSSEFSSEFSSLFTSYVYLSICAYVIKSVWIGVTFFLKK